MTSFIIHFVSRSEAKRLLHRALYDRAWEISTAALICLRDSAYTDEQLHQFEQTQLNRKE